MEKTSKKSLFSTEEKVIEEAEAVLARTEKEDVPLRRHFETLLEQYKKIYRQSGRLVRLSDIQQQKLNETLGELEKAKEAADSASRFKSMFLANMSHEIRTPMNAIIGLTSLALKTDLNPKVREYLNTVQVSAHSLLGIINDILDFSKIEAGKLDLESVDFQLDSIMGYISDLFSNRAAKKNIGLIVRVDDDVPRTLVGDPLRVGQILVNLASNALKFTEHGTIEIKVELDKIDRERASVRFSVSDTGIGIALEQLPNLFDSFTQADGSTTRNYGGTGLGLTICKLLVEMMGGNIHVESRLGSGSVFSFTVPFKTVATGSACFENRHKPVFRDENRPPVDSSEVRGTRVLLVEDNAINREVAEEILRNSNLIPKTAKNGKEAVEILRRSIPENREKFDLVLMDVQMPEMDGYEATRAIRSELKLQGLPIVAMTAHAMKGDREKCLAAGMNDYIAKPIDPDQLLTVISRWVVGSGNGSRDFDAETKGAKRGAKFPDSLPGIELNAVLKRLDGNRRLLLKVMKQFVDHYSRFDMEIKDAYESRDRETAQRMSHTIKGVAATFSANDLHAKAQSLEKAIGRKTDPNSDDWLEKIDEFGMELRIVLRSADYLVENFTTNVYPEKT
jgi:signal transduction histidine kinase/CheY-like chemotaxis protein/HPt (histidine-containing phosphotransfer) domain-containing protein